MNIHVFLHPCRPTLGVVYSDPASVSESLVKFGIDPTEYQLGWCTLVGDDVAVVVV